jgi:WD40 repeat protein
MKFSCQKEGCLKEAEKSCICDSKVLFCSLHFIDIHLELPGIHKNIALSDKIRNYYSKLREAGQKLEEAKILIISKGDMMMNTIRSIVKKNLLKLMDSKTEIAKIQKSTPQECLSLFEKAMIFEVVGEPLDNFEEIIKNYIRFNSNLNELEPLTIEIKKLIEDNQKMREEISELKGNLNYLEEKINSKIEFDDLSKTQEILEEKYGLILQGHTDFVCSVAITSDNKYVVSGSRDKTVRVWNLDKKTQKAVLQGHTDFVCSVAITSDNKHVVSGSSDKTVRMWNLDEKTQEAVLQGHTDSVLSVAVTSDNKYIVSGSLDNTVKVWNLKNKTQEAVLQGHTSSVLSVAITSDNKYVVSSSFDKIVRVWDLDNKTQETLLQGHTDSVWSIAITNDNKYVVYGSENKTVGVWNLKNKTQEGVLEGHLCEVIYAGITQDSKYAVSGSSDGIVKVWDLKNYKI